MFTERKKENIRLSDHGFLSWHKHSPFVNADCSGALGISRAVANGISCLNIDRLLVVKTLFKDIGHFRASQTWAYYFEVQVYFIPFIVGVKLISCRIFHFH